MLREEQIEFLELKFGKGSSWSPLPGDVVCDSALPEVTNGIVISLSPENEHTCMVLWSQMVSNVELHQARFAQVAAREIQEEIDADIMRDLMAMNK